MDLSGKGTSNLFQSPVIFVSAEKDTFFGYDKPFSFIPDGCIRKKNSKTRSVRSFITPQYKKARTKLSNKNTP